MSRSLRTNHITKPAARPAPTKAKAKTALKAKTKAKAGDGDNRVVTDVLLAIKPIHLANIASQQKNHEYRNYRLRDGVERLWLYETGAGHGRSAITYAVSWPAFLHPLRASVFLIVISCL
jgi:hypothetical protein